MKAYIFLIVTQKIQAKQRGKKKDFWLDIIVIKW